MERLGMTREARFREAVQAGGKWRDLVVHAILAQDWPGADVMSERSVPESGNG
jgi:RimJ/RimL family protein N-acetyltransferase